MTCEGEPPLGILGPPSPTDKPRLKVIMRSYVPTTPEEIEQAKADIRFVLTELIKLKASTNTMQNLKSPIEARNNPNS